MHPKKLLSALLFSLLLFYSCEKNIFQSEPEPEPVPGPRNYVWELDTLDMPMNYINCVWGATPNDVWAIGGGGTESDRLHHYDGTKWSIYTKEKIWCDGFTIFGFSTNNVWMGGGAGWFAHGAGIWHYNGIEWKEHYVYDVEGSWDLEVDDIWGPAPNDLYACGTISYYDGKTSSWRGFVLHYNGKNWREVVRAQFDSQFLTIRKEQDKLYVFSAVVDPVNRDDSVEFYEVKYNQLIKIYSAKESKINFASLYVINDKAYFTINRDIFRYQKHQFIKSLTIDNENFGYHICGRNEHDLFLRMEDGLAHYNGTDIKYLFNFPRHCFDIGKDAVLFEKEVFFCGVDRALKSYIFHGKLEE